MFSKAANIYINRPTREAKTRAHGHPYDTLERSILTDAAAGYAIFKRALMPLRRTLSPAMPESHQPDEA
jgi:hypothetical protein